MSSQFDAVLQLGKKIVDEMGIQRSVDTLGRWMAHYLAELIVEADSAQGQTKVDAQKRCREAILELWQHRYELPDGLRPFKVLRQLRKRLRRLISRLSFRGTSPNESVARRARIERERPSGSISQRVWIQLPNC